NFGPLLDKYEAELKAYEKLQEKLQKNPDDAKEQAAKQKVQAAATAAHNASGKYAASLKSCRDYWDSSNRTAKPAASELLRELSLGERQRGAAGRGSFCPAGGSVTRPQHGPWGKRRGRIGASGQSAPARARGVGAPASTVRNGEGDRGLPGLPVLPRLSQVVK